MNLVKSALDELFLKRVGILPLEDEIVGLFVTARATFLKSVVRVQPGNGLTLGPLVFLDDLLHAGAGGKGVGGYFVEGADLVGAAVEQVGV